MKGWDVGVLKPVEAAKLMAALEADRGPHTFVPIVSAAQHPKRNGPLIHRRNGPLIHRRNGGTAPQRKRCVAKAAKRARGKARR